MTQGSRSTGIVKWFNDQKGFGFITPDDGTPNMFVHQSSIMSYSYHSLSKGEMVEFGVQQGDNGHTKAVNVTGPNSSSIQGDRRGGGGGGRAGDNGGRCYSGGYGFNGRLNIGKEIFGYVPNFGGGLDYAGLDM